MSKKTGKKSSTSKKSKNNTGSIIAGFIVFFIIAFILLGGINQRLFIEFLFDWSSNVGNTVANWLQDGHIDINDDGIYIVPDNNNVNEYTPKDMYLLGTSRSQD